MASFILNLYSILFTAALVLISPVLIFRPKTRAGLKEKLGLLNNNLIQKLTNLQQVIWIHAVSVGEFNGAYPLVEAIKNKFPDWPLVISITTKAGHAMAEQRAGHIAQIIYFPFDLPWVIERMLSLINPCLVIIFETELWPNFIYSCGRRHIPIALINARMSPRSFNGYKKIKWFFAPLLNKLSLIGAQTVNEAQHYQMLSDQQLPIKVFGNLKYDWPAQMNNETSKKLKASLDIQDNDLVLIAGSTHTGEETMILDLYKHFLTTYQNKNIHLKIIIAPRHPERFEEVAKIIEKEGYTVSRYTKDEKFTERNNIFLLDTIGMLSNFYSVASVAFVGGTIAKIGGHNLLEPYLYGAPVVCGPYLHKTREVAIILGNEKALFVGNTAQEVKNKIIALLEDDFLRQQMGNAGKAWLRANRGAVAKSMDALTTILETISQKRTCTLTNSPNRQDLVKNKKA